MKGSHDRSEQSQRSSLAPGQRKAMEERMKETARNPESHFAERCNAVLKDVEDRDHLFDAPSARDPASKSIPQRVANPESPDRVVALTLFFEAASFVRALTPAMMSKLPDDEIRFLALCLGIDTE
jgi:hypothetical protein